MAILELGCGNCPNPVATMHHDKTAHAPHVDIAHDLNVLPWPWNNEAFTRIIAVDVFEHLKIDVADWLAECRRILEPGGLLVFQVPHASSWHAWADPTHRRGFHEITFDYWDDSTVWHQKYGACYGYSGWRVESREVRECELAPHGVLRDIRFVLRRV